MQNEELEHIIKDVLYQKHARTVLQNAKSKNFRNIVIRRIAVASAAIILLIIAYSSFNNQKSLPDQFIAENYNFPKLVKSRSSDSFIIDQYSTNLSKKEYAYVLEQLRDKPLTEKDNFYLAYLYFEVDSLSKVKNIISQTKWLDDYYHNEINWLNFLIAIKENASKTILIEIYDQMSPDHQSKATDFIHT